MAEPIIIKNNQFQAVLKLEKIACREVKSPASPRSACETQYFKEEQMRDILKNARGGEYTTKRGGEQITGIVDQILYGGWIENFPIGKSLIWHDYVGYGKPEELFFESKEILRTLGEGDK